MKYVSGCKRRLQVLEQNLEVLEVSSVCGEALGQTCVGPPTCRHPVDARARSGGVPEQGCRVRLLERYKGLVCILGAKMPCYASGSVLCKDCENTLKSCLKKF